jgi:Ca-activated chloride channel family protein
MSATKDWNDDPRLTALALGELDGDERTELERELADDAAGRAALAELRALAATLGGELAAELAADAGALPPAARARITKAARPRRRALRAVALVVGGLAAAGVAAMVLRPALVGGEAERVASAPSHTGAAPRSASRPAEGGSAAPTTGLGVSDVNWFGAPASGRELVHDADAGDVAALEEHLANQARGTPKQGKEQGDSLQVLRTLGYLDGGQDRLRGLGYVGEGRAETYEPIVENAFVPTSADALSTFSIDVDTASYANVRRFLRSGQLPPPDAVRIEEMINYFSYDYEATDGVHPFSITTEVAAAPWAPEHRLVRIGLRGDEIPIFEPKEKNLVFLIDVSGSMSGPAKLPLLKRSMRLLVDHLGARDRVGIVVYAGSSGVVLPPTPCDRKEEIVAAIERLEPGGSTHGSQGIELAYALCEAHRADGGVNRVILATDGDFNVGVTGDDDLVRLIERKRERGTSLSVLGFGSGNLKDAKMEKLADHGNGNYAYVDSLEEARKVLVREMGGTLETIAKDVKIQVVFDPEQVSAFRLIGYENRVLAHADFDDDRKDAGEIGAGHRVTALYEVVPNAELLEQLRALDYVEAGEPIRRRLGTVRLRYKDPDGSESRLIERPLDDPGTAGGSDDLRFAAGVAAFGMVLRGSEHAGGFRLEDAYALAHSGAAADPFGYRTELLRLIERAIELGSRGAQGR